MAEPGKPRRRWFQFGEPWGLLAKTNPRASWLSVARHAITGAVFGPIAYGTLIYFGGLSTKYLEAKLIVCSLLVGFSAALCEWQINRDDV